MGIICGLRNLHLSYGSKEIFKNADLQVETKDRIGLLGLNGHGKSSLFKILAERQEPDRSTPPCEFDKNREFFSVLLIPQELELPEKSVTVKDYFFFFYKNLTEYFDKLTAVNLAFETADESNMDSLISEQRELMEALDHEDAWQLQQQYESYLKGFGITDFDSLVESLSGGEQKKILLSLGLTARENLILWDEPTNHLDMETIQIFEEELSSSTKAFMLITHDRYLLGKVTNKIFHINLGKVARFEGSYTDYLEYLVQMETDRVNLLDRLKNRLRREQDWMRQGIRARGTRSKKRVEGFENLAVKVQQIKERERKELSLQITAGKKKSKALVQFKELSFGYENKKILNNITGSLYKGDKIGLLGPNGAGKSTLVKLIAGEITGSTGMLKLAEDLVIQHFTQKRDELPEDITPHELLGDGNDFITMPNGANKHVVTYFEQFLFKRDQIRRPLSTFSGGERNRLQMALNLKQAGDIWIFDEPTNDLDLETLNILEKALSEFKGTLILISHDRAFLSNVTNKTWYLDNGDLEVFEGGFSQTEAYLETLILEKELKLAGYIASPSYTNQKKNDPTKLSHADKTKLDSLPGLIKEKEALVSKIADLMEQIGNTGFENEESAKKLIQLSEKKDTEESSLMDLYEELETLQSQA